MGIVSRTVAIFLNLLYALLLARVLLSWFRPSYRTKGNGWFFQIDELIWRATEPFLAPIRKVLPTGGMGIDFSALVLFLLIQWVGGFLLDVLQRQGL